MKIDVFNHIIALRLESETGEGPPPVVGKKLEHKLPLSCNRLPLTEALESSDSLESSILREPKKGKQEVLSTRCGQTVLTMTWDGANSWEVSSR